MKTASANTRLNEEKTKEQVTRGRNREEVVSQWKTQSSRRSVEGMGCKLGPRRWGECWWGRGRGGRRPREKRGQFFINYTMM